MKWGGGRIRCKHSVPGLDVPDLATLSVPDNYPFPRIDYIIDKLHNAKYFSTIDICSNFWHIKINPKDTYKLGFVTMMGHYEWLVLLLVMTLVRSVSLA